MRLILILFLILGALAGPSSAFAQEPPPVIAADQAKPAEEPTAAASKKPKVYAEPAYFWIDDKGVEHVSKKSAIPSRYFDNFANKHPKITAVARGARKFAVGWLTPALTMAGGVRSVIGF